MAINSRLSHAEHSRIRGHLRTLRMSLTQARDALMHYKDDRVDRDRLEPAARRVDELMDMFVGDSRDSAQGALWLAEIQRGVDEVTNPKASAALNEARLDISALLEVMKAAPDSGAGAQHSSR